MKRVIELLEQWLPALACVSGAVVPVGQVFGDCPAPDLDAQVHEILDVVALQERRWPPDPGHRPVATSDL